MKIVTKVIRFIRSLHLLVWILVWSIVGILLGLFAQDFSKEYMGLLSSHIFLPMVKAIIVPLVFSTLIVGKLNALFYRLAYQRIHVKIPENLL